MPPHPHGMPAPSPACVAVALLVCRSAADRDPGLGALRRRALRDGRRSHASSRGIVIIRPPPRPGRAPARSDLAFLLVGGAPRRLRDRGVRHRVGAPAARGRRRDARAGGAVRHGGTRRVRRARRVARSTRGRLPTWCCSRCRSSAIGYVALRPRGRHGRGRTSPPPRSRSSPRRSSPSSARSRSGCRRGITSSCSSASCSWRWRPPIRRRVGGRHERPRADLERHRGRRDPAGARRASIVRMPHVDLGLRTEGSTRLARPVLTSVAVLTAHARRCPSWPSWTTPVASPVCTRPRCSCCSASRSPRGCSTNQFSSREAVRPGPGRTRAAGVRPCGDRRRARSRPGGQRIAPPLRGAPAARLRRRRRRVRRARRPSADRSAPTTRSRAWSSLDAARARRHVVDRAGRGDRRRRSGVRPSR